MARPKKNLDTIRAKSAVVYARVSTKEQSEEGYSIDAQLALLRSYALREGYTVRGEFVESETAKVSGRTAFTAMLQLVREERVQAILVEKTDRLYRNLKDHVRVDELDVEVHLVKEGEVISKDSRSHQKFVHGIKLLMAKNYSDNLSEEAKKGMLEKARQGIWPTKAPLGYVNISHGSRRIIEQDQARAELVRWLFQRYAEGAVSLKDLRREATAKGLTTRKGRKVAVNELHTLLQNPVYYGLIRWAGEEHEGTHEPLIDKATWSRVQEIMSGRNLSKSKPACERDFLYQGLLTCGRCGCMISAQTTKGHRYYACTGARGCSRKTVREEVITEDIAEKLGQLSIRPEVLEILRSALLESEGEEATFREEELAGLTRQREDVLANLRLLYKDKISGAVPAAVYPELKIQWETELVHVEAKIAAFGPTRRLYEEDGLALIDFASNAYHRFKTAAREDQREMAKSLLSNSTVLDGSVQVQFHKAFEMVLELNAEMAEKPQSPGILKKWLPAKDSNLD